MPHVIAVFGRSCVGKTEVATALATALNLPIRHCGEAIKARARELGVDTNALSLAEHKAVDEQTRASAGASTTEMIMEGNFLDLVLEGVPDVLLVQLTCEDSVRVERFIRRSNNQVSGHELRSRDASDSALRGMLYKAVTVTCNLLTINTTKLGIDEVVRKIIDWVDTSKS